MCCTLDRITPRLKKLRQGSYEPFTSPTSSLTLTAAVVQNVIYFTRELHYPSSRFYPSSTWELGTALAITLFSTSSEICLSLYAGTPLPWLCHCPTLVLQHDTSSLGTYSYRLDFSDHQNHHPSMLSKVPFAMTLFLFAGIANVSWWLALDDPGNSWQPWQHSTRVLLEGFRHSNCLPNLKPHKD